MRAARAAAWAAVFVAASAAAQTPPLPPPRPNLDAAPATPAPVAKPAPVATPAPEQETPKPTPSPTSAPAEGCVAALRKAGFDVEPAGQPPGANGACRIDEPVRLKAVPGLKQAAVRFPAEPVISCQFAERLGRFVGDLAAPYLRGATGRELKAVQTGPGFECRNRNRNAAGKISAHSAGIAIDISGFELADGGNLRIARDAADPVLAGLRTAGCGWFTTILGPGSDASHADHLHLDILQHGSSDRYRICQ